MMRQATDYAWKRRSGSRAIKAHRVDRVEEDPIDSHDTFVRRGLLLRPSPDVIFKRLGDEMVLFDLKTDRFFELNKTAARFWELLCAGCDPAQISAQMLEEFAVDAGELTSEAEALFVSLRQEGLVTVDE